MNLNEKSKLHMILRTFLQSGGGGNTTMGQHNHTRGFGTSGQGHDGADGWGTNQNAGCGGGGSWTGGYAAKPGGSGIVILRYRFK